MKLRNFLVTASVVGLTFTLGLAPATGDVPAAKKKVKTLRVLVTNDDGVEGEGIDLLVEALIDLPKVKVTVVAPADDKSGTGDTTTPDDLTASETTLISGYEATAVNGFPADTVNHALDELGLEPHVVLSGINPGLNLGEVAQEVSGTVGAAITAARRGIPSLAVSQGFGEPPDFAAGLREAIKWVRKHRKALSKGTAEVEVASINVPTCTTGEVRGLIEVPLAPLDDPVPPESDCESTLEDPAHDIEAFANGFATLSDVPTE